MKRTLRLLIALGPLAFTPVLFWLIADAYLNFGGGEKDIFVVLPWALWAILFGVVFLRQSRDGKGFGKPAFRAALWATGLLLAFWMVLYLFSWAQLGMS